MAAPQLRSVETASANNSVWRDVDLASFRNNVALLKQATEVARDKETYLRDSTEDIHLLDARYMLPFDTEKVFVNHLAFVAAIEKAAVRVTAVSLEEGLDSITVRLASNETVLPVVEETLRLILDLLSRCANRSAYISHGLIASSEIGDHLFSLCTLYESVNNCEAGTHYELQTLQRIARESHAFCTKYGARPEIRNLIQNKHLLQVNKIGRYWGLCGHITKISRKYRRLFERINMKSLASYKAIFLPTLPGMPSIKCHVHAEIQLLTFYTLNSDTHLKTPRALGVSRSACYLCYLFIRRHGHFSVSRTHGRLYDQWTVPDVFNHQHLQSQRLKFRQVLREVNNEILHVLPIEQQRARQRIPGRPFPNESDTTLPTGLPRSPLPSDAGTLLSGKSSSTITAITGPIPFHSSIMPPSEHSNEASPTAAQQGNGTPQAFDPPQSRTTVSSTSHPLHPQNLSETGLRYQPSPLLSNTSSPVRSLHTPIEGSATSPPPEINHRLSGPKPAPSSLATIHSWEYPVKQPIRPGRTIRTNTKNLNVSFEIEDPAEGSVQVITKPKIDNSSVKHTVDVKSMQPNESRLFHREGGEQDLVLNLQNGAHGHMTQIRMHWG
ncbi:MAG: hypothetical protein Q9217_005880 [Psora testacea]